MPVQSYPQLPTLHQWKKDSAVGNWLKPKRSDDPTLVRIDRMVNSLNRLKTTKGSDDEYFYKLGGMFFTTLYWNNNHKHDLRMNAGRRNSIMRLNLFAANRLAVVHGCGIGGLAAKLQQVYGKSMDQHGIDTDGVGGVDGRYMSIAKRNQLKVYIRNGLAYKLDLTKSSGYTLLHSSDSFDVKTGREGWGYVFSMSNELYTVLFGSGIPYHSSIMGGVPVKCAGMINFDHGVINYIKNDSGHYQPIDLKLAMVLRHLKTIGVDIRKIKVETEKDSGTAVETTGDKFLAANGNWKSISLSGFDKDRRVYV